MTDGSSHVDELKVFITYKQTSVTTALLGTSIVNITRVENRKMEIIFLSFLFSFSNYSIDKRLPYTDIQEVTTMLIVSHCYLTLRKLRILSRLLKPWNGKSSMFTYPLIKVSWWVQRRNLRGGMGGDSPPNSRFRRVQRKAEGRAVYPFTPPQPKGASFAPGCVGLHMHAAWQYVRGNIQVYGINI